MNLGKLEETAWKRTHPDLKQCLNVGEVHCHLTPYLTYAESADLLGNRFSEQEKISKIVMWMPTKGGDWFAIFVGILKKTTHGTGHRTIVDALQKNLLEVFRENNIAEEEVDSKIKAIFGSTPTVEVEPVQAVDGPQNQQSKATDLKMTKSKATGSEDPMNCKPFVNDENMTRDDLVKKYDDVQEKIKNLTNDANPITTRKDLNTMIENLEDYKILIEVVNEIEFMTAICHINGQINRCTVCDELTSSRTYYYYGKWGNVPVVIVRTGEKVGPQFQYGSWFETKKALYYMPNLKHVFGVGVCGGAVDKKSEQPLVRLGHVVVSSHIIGYDHQKKQDETDEKMQNKRNINRSPSFTLTEHSFYHFLEDLQNKGKWKRGLHFGRVLSGSWLVAGTKAQKMIMNDHRKDEIVFEMEGVGIAAACQNTDVKNYLVVKGVSDHANRDKNDDWQPAAATNANNYLSDMINKMFVPIARPPTIEE